ncbi:hypothetical protein MMPV_001922 [Pyropia vietnamensis]
METAGHPWRRHERVTALVFLAVAAAAGLVLLEARRPLPAGHTGVFSHDSASDVVGATEVSRTDGGGGSPGPSPPPDSLSSLAAALARRRADALRVAVRNVTIPALPSLGAWGASLWGGKAVESAAGGDSLLSAGVGGTSDEPPWGGGGGGDAPSPGRGVVSGAASMYTAKHQEAWATHCDAAVTPFCRAVYRLVVRTDAAHILDVECGANTGWLPKVLSRLTREYRRVHLTCVGVGGAGSTGATEGRGGNGDPLARARAVYAPFAGHVDFAVVPEVGLPSGAPDHLDVVLALHVLPRLSLIQSVRFFASLRDAGASMVIVDHYPAVSSNAEGGGQRRGGGHRYNLRLSPFSFAGEAFAWPLVDAVGGETGREVLGVDVDKMFQKVPEMM